MKKNNSLIGSHMLLLMALDIATIILSYYTALWVRFEFVIKRIPRRFFGELAFYLPLILIITLLVYYLLHLYHSIWKFASLAEAARIIAAYLILLPIMIALNLIPKQRLPWSCLFIAYVLNAAFCFGIRFGYRLLRYLSTENGARATKQDYRILLIGAGQAAREIIKDINLGNHTEMKIFAIVDDEPTKKGRYLEGIRIEGNRDDIMDLVEKYRINNIIFAIPTAPVEERQKILNICKETGCRLQTVPSLHQIIEGKVTVSKLRDVNIADLLGRKEIKVNNEEIFRHIGGKVVMVTGGGGSIGSELCRQIAAAGPKQLIIFDIYENNAYDIQI